MACNVSEILHNHLQLCQWVDELEFLCFVLCEIIESPVNPTRETNQIFDLLSFVQKIEKACKDPHGRLRELLQENALSNLKRCLKQTKQIRNLVAHHVPVCNRLMKKKQAVNELAVETLQDIIRRGAERYHIDQINWYPIAHTPTAIPAAKDFFEVGIILTELPVLLSRQKYLQNGAFCQEYLSTEHKYCFKKQRRQSPKHDDSKPERPSQKSKKKKRKGLSNHPHSIPSAHRREQEGVTFEGRRLENKKLAQPDVDYSLISSLPESQLYFECGIFVLVFLVWVNFLISILCYGRV